jgi:hypothetical protein
MNHTYEYRGFNIDVSVEADFSWNAGTVAPGSVGFAAIVKIRQVGAAAARFSPSVSATQEASLSHPKLTR